jgi:IS4 transposase
MDKPLLDLYSDYLTSSFGLTTATGLSSLLNGTISHDRITRFLSQRDFTSADLWQLVKPFARQVQSKDGVLIIDDTIEGKPYTDENELICWHFDHTQDRSVKGINLLTCLYYAKETTLPVAFALVKKPDIVQDKKTGKPKRQARETKNDLYRQMLAACVANHLEFAYVLNDIWFASAENMVFVKETLAKDFVMPLKANRKLTFDAPDEKNRHYVCVSEVPLEADAPLRIWLEGVNFPLLLVKQVFTNADGSEGILYLVTSDTKRSAGDITTLYQKRWKVEEYHKSLKSNLSFAKSPTKTVRTQSNHLFASLVAFVKMERLRLQTKLNHFAMKGRLYQAALKTAFELLQNLKENYNTA